MVARVALTAALLLLAMPAPAASKEAGGLRPLPEHAGGARKATFVLHGYFRTRGALLHNLDLDRGPTPTTGLTIYPVPPGGGQVLGSADARLRLDLGIEVGDLARMHLRVDVLDGLVLGSTPEGFPPVRWSQTGWASARQSSPTAGLNSFVSSIRVKEAYGEVITPVGTLAFGRVELPPWGLGIVTGEEEDLDDDWDDPVDRLSFATSLADHLLAVSVDISAVGPTSAHSQGASTPGQAVDLELADNAYTVSAAFGRFHDEAAIRRRRAAGKATVSYGAYATWRFQRADFPTFYLDGLAGEDAAYDEDDSVARELHAVMADGWARLHAGPVRLELEVAYLWSRVGDPSVDPSVSLPTLTASQFGGMFEAEVEPVRDRLFVQLGVGLASGDSAPGLGVAPPVGQVTGQPGDLDAPQFDLGSDLSLNNFRFHPGYRVDLIFWRSIVGAVTDAFLVRPELRFYASPAFSGEVSVLLSAALEPTSTPTGRPFYGGELDLGVRWAPTAGFEARVQYGLFLPGPALNHPDEGWAAKPAQAFRGTLAVVW